MKPTIFKLSAFVLLFVLIWAGCKKDEKEYDPTSIVGKWKQIKDNSCVGFSNSMIEFTKDSIFKSFSGNVLIYSSKISIRKGKYDSDTVYFEKSDTNYPYMYLTKIGNDTLKLDPPIVTITSFCTTFKRLN